MERIHVQLPDSLLADLDAARGDTPRAAFVRRAIENELAAREAGGVTLEQLRAALERLEAARAPEPAAQASAGKPSPAASRGRRGRGRGR